MWCVAAVNHLHTPAEGTQSNLGHMPAPESPASYLSHRHQERLFRLDKVLQLGWRQTLAPIDKRHGDVTPFRRTS